MAYTPQNPNGQATSANSSPVVIASDQSTLPISIASDLDSNASGTLTASGQVVALTLNGKSGVSAQITGTWVGTLQFEATVDGTTYQPINAVQASTTNIIQVITVNGLFRLTPSGLTQVRVNMTAFTSGSAVVTLRGSSGVGGTFLNQSLPTGANILGKVSIDQTTPGTTNAVSVTNTNLPVTGTFFQATQPVSATALPLPTGASTEATLASLNSKVAIVNTGAVTISNALPVGANIVGKFGIDQTTPGTTNAVSVTNASIPVTGTFFQTTQPVSLATTVVTQATGTNLHVVVDSAPTTPVTGTFFQATQPVSLATTVVTQATGTNLHTVIDSGVISSVTAITNALPTGANIIGKLSIDQTTPGTTNAVSVTNTSLPVTGTFFQATQPVSLATVSVTQATGTNLHTVIDSGTITAITNALPTGANTIGAVNISAAQTLATVTTVGAVTAITNALPTGANIIGKLSIDQTTQGVTNAVSVTSQPELVTTGTITTTDIVVAAPSGTGTLLSGTSTAGSYVSALATGGNASVVIGITGLTSGTIYYEGSADSTTGTDGNWISLNMKQAGVVNTQISSSATTNGLFRGNTAGIRYIRMRSVGTLTGTPAITLRLSAGVAGEFLFGSIPTGTNTIGTVNISASQTLATVTTVGAVTAITNALPIGANVIGKVSIDQTTPGTTNAVSVTNTSLPVTGTFFQATQPVSLASTTITGSVAVTQATGTNLHAVIDSGTISSVTAITNALPVGANIVGKFGIDQTTPGTTNAVSVTNASLPVTGTFFQATQPVSIASAIDVSDRSARLLGSITNTAFAVTTLPALPTGANTIGAVNIAVAQTLATVTTVGAVTAITNALPTGANTIGATNFNIANVSTVTILQNAVAVTGNGNNLTVTGYGTAVLQISGTFVASINFEASVDAGVTWTAISATQVGFGDIFSVVSTIGTFRLTTTGLDLIRSRVTWTSGTSITINGRTTNAINASKIVKLATGANTIGTVNISASQTLATVTTVGAVTAITNALPTGANTIGTVNISASQTLATVTTVGAVTAITNALPTGANTIGAVNIASAQTLATVSTVTAVTAITNALPTGANKIGTVDIATAPAVAKGTQGANALPTQSMKDSGRVGVAITCYQAPGIITTEALFAASTFAVSRDGGTPTAVTQFTVTTGKRFVVQSIVIGIKNNAAAAGTSKLVLRYSGAAGTIATTSSVIVMLDLGSNSATAGAYIGPTEMALPDGMELISASTFGFTNLSSAITMLHTITINGYEY